jgi:hypothetical protein
MNSDTVTKANFLAGLFISALGVAAIVWLIPAHVAGATADNGKLTPGFMPRVAAWSMVAFGLAVAVSNLRVIVTGVLAVAEESEENEELVFGRTEIVNAFILIVLSALYVAGLICLGFLVPTALVLGFTAYFAGFRRPVPLAGFAITFPLLLEQLLWHVLKIPLPDFPLVHF